MYNFVMLLRYKLNTMDDIFDIIKVLDNCH